MNTQTEDLNDAIKSAGEIGKQLTQLTDEEKVIDQFMSKTTDMFNAEYVYLFENIDDWLEMTHLFVAGRSVPFLRGNCLEAKALLGRYWLLKRRYSIQGEKSGSIYL